MKPYIIASTAMSVPEALQPRQTKSSMTPQSTPSNALTVTGFLEARMHDTSIRTLQPTIGSAQSVDMSRIPKKAAPDTIMKLMFLLAQNATPRSSRREISSSTPQLLIDTHAKTAPRSSKMFTNSGSTFLSLT
jgi:hypothetical protein